MLQVAAGPLPRLHLVSPDSDLAFFDRWGARIAAGDLLQRAPFHPTTDWMATIADQALRTDPGLAARAGLTPAPADPIAAAERLWDRWLGGATYYQEPAYPYLIGLTYRLTGRGVWHVFAWQLALGVAGVLLVHHLARRLFSETAGAVAGALAVLAPIPLLYEVALLRDFLVVLATLALVALMRWTVDGGRRRWLVLGLAFGGASLVKQSFLLFPLAMGAWRLAAARAPTRDRLAAAGLTMAGVGLALLPAVLRNLAVGAPSLAMNGSASGMLALYHVGSATPFDLMVSPEMARVLLAADGRFLPSLVEAARTHADLGSLLLLEGRKLLYAFHPFEAPNNVDYYLFRHGAPVLAALPATLAVLLPLAGVGLASRRAAAAAWPVLVAIAATLPGLVLGAALSRYRAPLTAALLPLAGAGAVRLWAWIAARRVRPLAAAAIATGLYLAWAAAAPPGKAPRDRAGKYARSGLQALGMDEPALAALCFQESLRLAPGAPAIAALLAQAEAAEGDAGRTAELGARARAALEADPAARPRPRIEPPAATEVSP